MQFKDAANIYFTYVNQPKIISDKEGIILRRNIATEKKIK
jgi:hypothetical protein